MGRILFACVIFSCHTAYAAQSLSQDLTVSVSRGDKTKIVVTKRDFGVYTTYVKREFNCTDSTVRYLGSSASPTGFDAEQQDKYFSRVSDTVVPSALLSEVCKDEPSPLTASQ